MDDTGICDQRQEPLAAVCYTPAPFPVPYGCGPIIDAAISYIHRGWSVVPIDRGEKFTLREGWQLLRLKDYQSLVFINKNVGVILGEASGGLIDIDLDHPLAVELAPLFLPLTGAVFGRPGKPRSHWVYRVSQPPKTKKWQVPKGKRSKMMLVELRSTGAQTVFPPSIHTSGEQIQWYADGDPAPVEVDYLRGQVQSLADACRERLGIPPEPERSKPPEVQQCVQHHVASGDVVGRARAYIAKIPGAISGCGGGDATYYVACTLVIRFALDGDTALELLEEWNLKCEPPWSRHELKHKIEGALNEPGVRGSLLTINAAATASSAYVPQLAPERDLAEYRRELEAERLKSLDSPGLYLDTSPTGTGKTFADGAAMKKAGTSWTVVATHRNCAERVQELAGQGIDAAADPPLNEETCYNLDEAARAIDAGLSPAAAVCQKCHRRDDCGYRPALARAEQSPHRITTHTKAVLSFDSIAEGRRYITIHEEPDKILRHAVEVPARLSGDLKKIVEVADRARHIKLDESERFDKSPDMTAQNYFWELSKAAQWLGKQIATAEITQSLEIPAGTGTVPNIDRSLWRAMSELDIWPDGDAVRICKAIAAGTLHDLVIRVDRVPAGGGAFAVQKAAVAIWKRDPPENSVVWMNDATADVATIEQLAGCPVMHRTPTGRPRQLHPVVQVPLDVTKGSSPAVVISTLRALLMALPGFVRVGVICDRNHISVINGNAKDGTVLDERWRRRIVRIEHFRSGEGRGSNKWIEDCDVLVVLGTPRVPPRVIKSWLIRKGLCEAAARDEKEAGWSRRPWTTVTSSSQWRSVIGLGYRDEEWQAAHRAIVSAELRQSVGRGRSVCENGIPVVVASTEEMEFAIADQTVLPVSDSMFEVLEVIRQLQEGHLSPPSATVTELSPPSTTVTGENLSPPSAYIYIGNGGDNLGGGVTTRQIVERLKKCESGIRKNLTNLETSGFVKRIGERGGWILASVDFFIATQRQDDPPAAPPEPVAIDWSEFGL